MMIHGRVFVPFVLLLSLASYAQVASMTPYTGQGVSFIRPVSWNANSANGTVFTGGAALRLWSNPSFSPDGEKVAFLSFALDSKIQLCIANLQTKRLFCFPEILIDSASPASPVTMDLVTPRFTPDGTRILFAGRRSEPPGNAGVFLSNLDGTGVHSLFECSICAGFQGNGISLSSDGQLVAFAHGHDGQPGAITVIDVQGRAHSSFLTDIQERVDPTVSFSPDGSKILFASFHSITLKARVFLADLQTRSLQILQQFQDASLHSAGIKSPFFSPDGREIVFSAPILLPGHPKGELRYHVFKAGVTSARRTMLTSDAGVDPVFLPNGVQIVFVPVRRKTSGALVQSGIYLMGAAGQNRRQVARTSSTGEVKFVVSPDGMKIAYTDGPWDQRDLFLVNIDGTARIRLRDLLQ